MASINVRVDNELEALAYRALERLGVTSSGPIRQALQYLAERGELPLRPVLLIQENESLISLARERLAAPRRVRVHWMAYKLEFDARALKEWRKAGDTVGEELRKKLAAVLLDPASKPIDSILCNC